MHKMKLCNTDKMIINAVIVSGIAFVSTLSVSYPPMMENIYSGIIAFTLALLTQLKTLVEDYGVRPPKIGVMI